MNTCPKFNVASTLLRATSTLHGFLPGCFSALQNICSCFILAKELLPINLVEDAQTEVNIDCTSGELNLEIPQNKDANFPRLIPLALILA